MADQTFQNPNTGTASRNPGPSGSGSGSQGFQQSASQGFQQAAGAAKSAADSAKSAAEQALSDGRDLKNKAMSMAGASTDAIKDQAAGLVDAAKGYASQAADKLKDAVDDQKNAGAEYVGSLADTMRRAAREFDKDLPIAGSYIRKAASQVEMVSDSIKTGNFSDLLRETQDFARRQPTAFLGLAVLAGFGAVRFLKSSADASSEQQFDVRVRDGGRDYSAGGGAASSYAGRRTGNEGYRDGFSK
jgi:hypothetical protein